jgi:hypothetical protein
MERKPHACLWPLRAHIPRASKQRRALAAVQQPDFDPNQGYEWPARPPEVRSQRPVGQEVGAAPAAPGS